MKSLQFSFTFVLLLTFFIGCKESSSPLSTDPIPPAPINPLKVIISFGHEKTVGSSFSGSNGDVSGYHISLFAKDTLGNYVIPVVDAAVSVNGIDIPQSSWNGTSWAQMPSYLPGQQYVFSMPYHGQIFSETLTPPGGFSIDSTLTNARWLQNGNYGYLVLVKFTNSGLSVVYSIPSVYDTTLQEYRSYTFTSPQILPTKNLCQASGQYDMMWFIATEKRGAFNSSVSSLAAYDNYSQYFNVP